MDMEQWLEVNAFEIDDGGDLIAVDDLRELLKTHTIVPNEPTEAMFEAASLSNVFGGWIRGYKAMLKAAQEN